MSLFRLRRSQQRRGFISRRLAETAREGGYVAVITVIISCVWFTFGYDTMPLPSALGYPGS